VIITLESNFIYKWLGIFGLGFFSISIIELLFFILLNTVINMNLDGQLHTIGIVIFTSEFMSPHSILIGTVIFSSIIIYIALGVTLYIVAHKKSLENLVLAKFILLIGLFLLIGGFFKMSFIVFLGRTTINTGTISINFQDAIYNQLITPIFGAIVWVYLIGVICCLLISGLIFGAVGLKWILNQQGKSSSTQTTFS
jgi:hypothetical protein